MNRRSLIAAIAAVAALTSTATAAQAHVTLQPKEAPAGGFARLDVRVPNEDDSKATTKVVVQMPAGFAEASYEPVPGWRVAVAKRKLATPVKTDEGDTLTEEVDKLTFTATGKGIAPGQFQDFGLSVGLPDKPAGTKLTFKALQTYAGGNVVRWIGAPGSDHPAPQVTLVAADAPAGAAAPAAAASDEQDDDDDGNGLAIVALVVGALGLLAGAAGLLAARRPRTAV
jgi:periplasmic copper chaperone A